jgi:hypothetical protein
MIGVKDGFDFHKAKIDSSVDFISDVVFRVTNKKVKIGVSFIGRKDTETNHKSDKEKKSYEIHQDFVREAEDIFGSKI